MAGATNASYLLVSADGGSTLRVTVTASNAGGSAAATSAASAVVTTVAAAAPVNTAVPQISGVAQVAQTLTGTQGTWAGTPTSYAYQWQRCDTAGGACANIAAANAATYLLASADANATLRLWVAASNSVGSTVSISVPTAIVPGLSTSTSTSTPRFGIAAGGNIQNFNSSDLAHYLDSMKSAGAQWLRFDLNWNVIQNAGPTSYNWGPFDAVVNAANARGIQLLAGILYTPPWARGAGTSSAYPPTNLNDYANFAKVAAQHYAPLGVHAYEIWNEPNIGFWLPSPDPARYTQMLKLAYTAIKSADASSTVISAGLSPYGSYGQSDSGHMNPINFLQQMYANGAHGYMDAVGWHPYNFPYGLSYANWSAWSQMSETSPSARSLMVANGDGNEQIWATEFGAPTGSTSSSMTETAQAQLITDSYAKLKSWSWAGPGFLYSFRDNGTDMSNIENAFGIMRYDWSLKPGFTAYHSAVAGG